MTERTAYRANPPASEMTRPFRSTLLMVACLLLGSICAGPGQAQVTAARTALCYPAGQELTISVEISYTGQLSSLSMAETLPAGWTWTGVGGTHPPAGAVQQGSQLQMLWLATPDTGPLTFTYMVNVPPGTLGNRTIAGAVYYTIGAGDLTLGLLPNTTLGPCSIGQVQATRSLASCYTEGTWLNVSIEINYAEALSSLSLRETLPEGWVWRGVGGANPPAGIVQNGNALEMLWFTIPATGPLSFTYDVSAPFGSQGQEELSGEVFCTIGAGDLTQGSMASSALPPCEPIPVAPAGVSFWRHYE